MCDLSSVLFDGLINPDFNVMLETYLSGSIKLWSQKQEFKSLSQGLGINIEVESKNSLLRLLP